MGLLDWFLGKKEPDITPVLAARPSAPLPPRNATVPGAVQEAIKPAGLAAPAFAGAVQSQLSHDLSLAASQVTDPGDRLYVSSLIRAVKNDGVELPAMPEDILRVQRILADPDAGVGDLARAVKRDPAMAAKFVAIANSALYSRGERINVVDDAVVRVGLNQASAIIMAIVAKAKMFRLPNDEEGARRLHQHALAAAAASASLAKGHTEIESDAFIAGMLHDIGRVYMLQVAANQRIETRGKKCPRDDTVDDLVERLHAGFSALVAERWEFSPQLVAALQFHHLPERSGMDATIMIPDDAERLTFTVAAADVVTYVMLQEEIEPERVTSLEAVLAKLEVGAIDEVVVAAQESYDALMTELGDV